MAINPFDEIAGEEAIRLREKGVATDIVAVSIGDLFKLVPELTEKACQS